MAGREPPSFKTDVHRAPTKKWADAKSYSYAGDDWGGYDEYDEYGSYEEPPLPPKATGLRKSGQALPSLDTGRAAAAAASSANNPSTAPVQRLQRQGSFEYGDDRRNFSAGGAFTQEPGAGPVPDILSTSKSISGYRKPSQDSGISSVAPSQPAETKAMSRSSQESNPPRNNSVTNPETFLSQAQEVTTQPFQANENRTSTSSQPTYSSHPPGSTPTAAGFPARTSSLSHAKPTRFSEPTPALAQVPTIRAPDDATGLKEQTTSTAVPSSVPRFVRPADIYKRMEEEREKERLSLDSGRPSMESLTRSPKSDSLERLRGVSGSPSSRLGAPLETVPERKSEYYMPGFTVNDPALAKAIGAQTAPVDDGPKEIPSLPQLHRVSGFGSDFWDLSSTGVPDFSVSSAGPTGGGNVPPGPAGNPEGFNSLNNSSQPQSGLGIRSAVDHAFEPSEALSPHDSSQSSALGSNVSRDNSTAGNSTAGISPIMSGVPLVAQNHGQERASHQQPDTNGSTVESQDLSSSLGPVSTQALKEPESIDDHAGSSHSRNISTTSVITQTPSNYLPDSDVAKHDDGAARKLEISTNSEAPEASSGAVVIPTPSSHYGSNYGPSTTNATPIDGLSAGSLSRMYTFDRPDINESPVDSSQSPSKIENAAAPQYSEEPSDPNALAAHTGPPDTNPGSSPTVSRAASPSKGRVRDLATQFDELHGSRRNSTTSLASTASSWADPSKRSVSPDQSTADDDETELDASDPQDAQKQDIQNRDNGAAGGTLDVPERPQLPGAWVSYADSTRSDTPQPLKGVSRPESENITERVEHGDQSQSKAANLGTDDVDFAPDNNQRAKTSQVADDPMSSLQKAGDAIAASLMSTVGLTQNAAQSGSKEVETQIPGEDDLTADDRDRSAGNIYPKPLGLEQSALSADSSAAPTPPPKDTPLEDRAAGARNDYFNSASLAPPKQRGVSPLRNATADAGDGLNANVLPSDRQISLETSSEAAENDRLHNDIVRSLNVPEDTSSLHPVSQASSLAPPSPRSDDYRESMGLPREYDSYWASTSGEATGQTSSALSSPALPSITTVSPQADDRDTQETPRRPSLSGHRFSWEQSDDTSLPSPPETRAAAAPGDVTTADSGSPETIGNDLMSSTVYSPPQLTLNDPSSPQVDREMDDPSSSRPTSGADDLKVAPPSIPQTQLGNLPKVLTFQEIASMSNYNQRLSTYNQTRNEFARMDTGLQNWLSYMVAEHPEHGKTVITGKRASLDTSLASSVRNKISPGIAKITRGTPSSSSTPYYQQYLDSAGGLPSAGTAHFPTTPQPATQAQATSSPNSQGQTKRKDLLQTASVLGGKATTGAKGLFAKGKNKLRGSDKGAE